MKTELEKIYQAGLKFLVPLTPQETYVTIVREALKLVKGDSGSILLAQRGNLKRVYASDSTLYKIKPRKRGWMYTVYKNKRPILLTAKDITPIHPQFKATEAKSNIIFPLFYKNQPFGVISVQSKKENPFTRKELDILRFFAPLASLAIRKTQLYDTEKRAVEARDLFISVAAHELRTPLTTIVGYADLLHKKTAHSKTQDASWIQQILWESRRLSLLVNELLEVSRAKRGKLQFFWKECDLSDVIERCINNFSQNYPTRKLIINTTIKKGALIIGDFDKLIQAFINVLANSAKYSPPSTSVRFDIKKEGKFFVLTVQDKGRGISKEELAKVFEGFYKSDVNEEGMGLGLYLVKTIIQRHHGSIKINSKVGIGTSIEIKLPVLKS